MSTLEDDKNALLKRGLVCTMNTAICHLPNVPGPNRMAVAKSTHSSINTTKSRWRECRQGPFGRSSRKDLDTLAGVRKDDVDIQKISEHRTTQ